MDVQAYRQLLDKTIDRIWRSRKPTKSNEHKSIRAAGGPGALHMIADFSAPAKPRGVKTRPPTCGQGVKVGLITNDQANHLVDTTMLVSRDFRSRNRGRMFLLPVQLVAGCGKAIDRAVEARRVHREPVGSCTDLWQPDLSVAANLR